MAAAASVSLLSGFEGSPLLESTSRATHDVPIPLVYHLRLTPVPTDGIWARFTATSVSRNNLPLLFAFSSVIDCMVSLAEV